MGGIPTTNRLIEVTLLRPDASSQTFTLAEGATLADLLREAGAAISSPNLLVDGRPIEEALVLTSGMTIAIDAEDRLAPPNGSWQATVGTFSHPDFWREVIAEGRAIREADREAARNQPEQADQ